MRRPRLLIQNEHAVKSATAVGSTTDDLIDHFATTTGLPRDLLERSIPNAIDAVYVARGADGTMHHAGAFAAVVTLQALRAEDFGWLRVMKVLRPGDDQQIVNAIEEMAEDRKRISVKNRAAWHLAKTTREQIKAKSLSPQDTAELLSDIMRTLVDETFE